MHPSLTEAAARLERATDLSRYWRIFAQAVRDEGFDFWIYVVQPEAGGARAWSNLPEYEVLPPEDDPFLHYCCRSYDITLTGPEYATGYDISEAARRFIDRASLSGFRSGLGIPVRVEGSGLRAGFNLGTRLPRARFDARMVPRAADMQAFCLLAHRHFTVIEATVPGPGGLSSLSEREREVLALLAEGLTRPRVARRLGISTNTVSSHTKAIYRKMGVSNQIEAIRHVLTPQR